jgi:type I restriction enzyme, S subunit
MPTIRGLPIPILDPDEQSALASVLCALDDKIELNRQMNETLEATARAIFNDWFVDFGPARARMEGQAPYLASKTWSLFPERLDDNGTPEGWQPATLDTVAHLNPESWSAQTRPSQVDYVDLANTKWGTIETTEVHTWDAAPSRARRVLRSGDTIVGTVRPGNGSYAFVDQDGLTGSTGFAVLRPKRAAHRELTYCAATSVQNIDRLSHLADGAAYPAVRPDVVASTKIVLGPRPVIDAFSAMCAPLIDRCVANRRENETLAATRDLLLPKLMSGEITVSDAQRLAGQAAC